MPQSLVSRNTNRIIAEKGLKKKVVAQWLGLSMGQFSAMLTGRKIINAEHIEQISRALDVEPNELFKKLPPLSNKSA